MKPLLIGGNTHPGRRRKENQDAWIARSLWSDDKALLVVIDGVGGYAGGEKAAAIAKDCIEQYMQSPSGDTLTMLREAVVFANNRIAEERTKDPHTSEMCCVLTAVVADAAANCIYFVHVGDTRLYRYRDGKLQKLTRDHSFVGIKEDAGEISEQEAMEHPHRNQILREVGAVLHRLDDPDFIDYGREPLVPGDLLLLCSDGLTDMVTSQQIIGLLLKDQSLPDKLHNLVSVANKNGGYDNITVVLMQYAIEKAALPTSTVVPATVKASEPVGPTPGIKKKSPQKPGILLILFLLLLLVAGASWYFEAPKKQLVPQIAPVTVPDSSAAKPAERETHTAVTGPSAAQIPDTLKLSSTQDFADIKHYTDSTGKELVLIPAKTGGKSFAAVAITTRSGKPGDTVLVRNLRLMGFETGIDIRLPVVLQTENLVFENTTHPFHYFLKPGEKHAFLLFMNTVKQ